MLGPHAGEGNVPGNDPQLPYRDDDGNGGSFWTPRPDPTKLTDAAIDRATTQFRRELDALRVLLSERIQTALIKHDTDISQVRETLSIATSSLQHLLEARMDAMDNTTQHQFQQVTAASAEHATARDKAVLALHDLFNERIDAIDKATDLRLRVTDEMPAATREQIDQLRKLHEERFSSISQQFTERDVRTDQASKSAKEALDAALQAAKELVNAQGEASGAAAVKSETSFTKQIDQIGTIISTLEKALDARITELKERIDRGEGTQSGQQQAIGGSHYEATFEQTARIAAASQQRATISTIVAGIAILVAVIAIIVPLMLRQ